jgi:nucleoside-diphosphate-sugar epimerase
VRIFLAGASGVIGMRLLPLLVRAGHAVAGMTRTSAKAERLRALGAEPVVCDVYDTDRLRRAVVAFEPDLVIHQLTDLPDDEASIGSAEGNARMRREGTRNLLAAAHAAAAPRFFAQSVAWDPPGDGGLAKAELERMTLEADGVVLRYGRFYGPGTYHEAPPAHPRIQIDEAASRTAALLDVPAGVYEIVEAS